MTSKMPTVRPLMKEAAYAEIKKKILSGSFEVGRFLSERQLAAALEMSQTPVRAALEKLQIEGLVAVSPQQGIVVRDLSVHDIADHFEFREALEVFVVRRVAGRLTPPQVSQLRENLGRQRQAVRAGDVPGNIAQDAAFHLLLCEFLGNREIIRSMEGVRDKIHRVIVGVQTRNPDRMKLGFEEHGRIAEAVIRGDPEAAERTMLSHLESGRAILLSRRAV
jgi:DNA-binding GntR family transcriptional regulator